MNDTLQIMIGVAFIILALGLAIMMIIDAYKGNK
jgi:hypothetical protein